MLQVNKIDSLLIRNDSIEIPIIITTKEKRFHKMAKMRAQPILQIDDSNYIFKPIFFQGEKIKGNNIVVPYKTSKTFTFSEKIKYNKVIDLALIRIEFIAQLKDKEIPLGEFILYKGIIKKAP